MCEPSTHDDRRGNVDAPLAGGHAVTGVALRTVALVAAVGVVAGGLHGAGVAELVDGKGQTS